MGRKKKPFIDKKNATTYKLVHRSQHDPLIADEDAHQLVLSEVPDKNTQESDVRQEQQREHGVFFDDDYNYMQHLRDRGHEPEVVWEAVNPTRAGKMVLPTCVLPSATEEPVGMLNLAAPRGLDLSLDPDIVAALDDDFDFEDPEMELEDDFINLAEGAVLEEYGSEEEEDADSLWSGGRSDDGEDDGMCRFTEYSVSSSVLPRNEGLTMLDDKFEEMFKDYDALGAAEEELKPVDELGLGNEPQMILEQLCSEFERNNLTEEDEGKVNKARVLALAEKQETKPERREVVVEDLDHRAAIPWDCETILSTYSNIYNHPKLIEVPSKIRLNRKGVVVENNPKIDEEDEDAEEEEGEGEESVIMISNYRTKTETVEEKKARKKAVKESQRVRRQIKKATKEVFKEEDSRERKIITNRSGKMIKL